MKRILFQPWGGLGDNLQYSTLPEKFAEIGDETYISDRNVYRNPQTYDLVWKSNPFVKGISSEKDNAGSCKKYCRCFGKKTIIWNWEYLHGLTPSNEIPKVYYKPKTIESLKGVVLVDLSGHTSWTAPKNIDEILKSNFSNQRIVIPTSKHAKGQCKDFRHDEEIEVNDLFVLSDMIHSCDYFVCSFSGNATLASALNKVNTTCFLPPEIGDFVHFLWPNINYEQT